MDKLELNNLIRPLINIYDDIELDIIKKILQIVDNYDGVKGSLDWYLNKLTDMKKLSKESLEVFKKDKTKIKNAVVKLINESSQNIDYLDTLEKKYQQGSININPSELFNSTSFKRIVENAIKDTNDINDLIQSKVLEGLNENYKFILNKAYVETASGVYTYQESIRRALNDLAEEGITAGHYSNGRKMSIESIVRRDVLTRVNKLVGDIDIENCKVLETNLVYVDQHLGARIRTKYTKEDYEAHAEWQGKVYMIEGSNKKYKNLKETTGYGEMLGLCGINCRHRMRPYFEGDKIDDVIDLEENKRIYELEQTERAYERKLRKLKRKREVSLDKEQYKKYNDRYQEVSKSYNQFLKGNNLNRDYSREYIGNRLKYKGNVGIDSNYTADDIYNTKIYKLGTIDKSQIYDAVQYFENQIYSKKVENAIIIQKDGTVIRCVGKSNGVGIYGNLEDAIVTHNHPDVDGMNGGSFGEDDFVLLKNNIDIKELRAVDSKFEYSVKALKKLNMQDYYDAYRQVNFDISLRDDIDYKHCVMLELATKGLVKYERAIRKRIE